MSANEMNRIPLADAALRLGVSWHQAWRLLLTGTLDGKKEAGHWVVTEASVEQEAARREAPQSPQAA